MCAYVMSSRVKLVHINVNAHTRRLNKLHGQAFCTVVLISKPSMNINS